MIDEPVCRFIVGFEIDDDGHIASSEMSLLASPVVLIEEDIGPISFEYPDQLESTILGMFKGAGLKMVNEPGNEMDLSAYAAIM